MDKIKLLTFAVVTLLLLNLGTLGFLILSKPHDMPPHGRLEPKYLIIEKLHFDKKQQRDYRNLIQWHRKTISEIEDKIHDTKNRLYVQLLKTEVDQKLKDSLVTVLGDYQKRVETTHFTHFHDIRKICRTDQLDDYNDLTEALSSIFSKPRRLRDE